MKRLLEACNEYGVKNVYFSDSIGSLGKASPRALGSAKWLAANPNQDPGSDYGLQKRECRDLLAEYTQKHGFNTRWAIIPGVLHTQASWGGGTTEYALDALFAAAKGETFVCAVPENEQLPMIHSDDLIEGEHIIVV